MSGYLHCRSSRQVVRLPLQEAYWIEYQLLKYHALEIRYKNLLAHGYEKLMILTICQAYRKVRKLSENNNSQKLTSCLYFYLGNNQTAIGKHSYHTLITMPFFTTFSHFYLRPSENVGTGWIINNKGDRSNNALPPQMWVLFIYVCEDILYR